MQKGEYIIGFQKISVETKHLFMLFKTKQGCGNVFATL
jgi:hypothetical protein